MKKTNAILSIFAASLLVIGCGKKEDPNKDALKNLVADGTNVSVKEVKKEDVTDDYQNYDDAGITKIYSFLKGNDVLAYGFKAEAQGYTSNEKIVYEVVYNVSNNEILGINIVSEKETDEIGGALLETESFLNQFKGLEIPEIKETDNQTGPTADQTLDGLQTSLLKVSNYYLTEIKDEEPYVEGYGNEENAIKGFFTGDVTLTNVTANYTNLSFDAYNSILSIYEVKAGTTLVGYGFVVVTSGLGTGLVYATAIDISNDNIKGMYSTKNNEHYGKDTLKNPSFLSQFIDLPIENISSDIDVETGVTLTTEGIKNSLSRVSEYYTTNIKEVN